MIKELFTKMEKEAHIIAQVLQDYYERLKYDSRFTVWGVAYYWNGRGGFDDKPAESGLGEVVGFLINEARRRGEVVVKPEAYIPKGWSEEAHYSLLCMRNRDLITSGFMDLTGIPVKDIVDDTRLMHEALETYIDAKEKGIVHTVTNLLGFLLHYQRNEPYLETTNPHGQFRNLFERTYMRFESGDMIEGIGKMVPGESGKALALHQDAIASSVVCVSPELIDAYRKYREDNAFLPPLSPPPLQNSLRAFLGKVRKRKGNYCMGILDLESFMEEHMRRRHLYAKLNPNKVLRARLFNKVLEQSAELFRQEGKKALEILKERADACSNAEEQKALYTTIEFLQSMSVFDDAESIHHSMTVRKSHGR